jgi:two-component system, NtrC family, sensor histidine kinase KinB
MKLRSRLTLSHGVVVVLAICIFPVALYAIQHLATATGQMSETSIRAVVLVDRIGRLLGVEHVVLMKWLVAPYTRSKDDLAAADRQLRDAVEDARSVLVDEDEKAALETFIQSYLHLQNTVALWQAGQTGSDTPRELLNGIEQARVSVLKVHDLEIARMLAAARQTDAFAKQVFALLGLLALLLLFLGVLVTIRLARSVTRPVDHLAGLVRRMRDGDFEIAFERGSIAEFNALGSHIESMAGALSAFRSSNLEQIVAEQRRTSAVLASIEDGLVIFDEDGIVESINAIAERQLDTTVALAQGRSFEELTGNHQIGLRVREVLDAREPNESGSPEWAVERAGEQRILAYALTRFSETEGVGRGAVMILRDVTVEREFDKMRSEFVLRASHELRTPVTSVRMGLGLLAEKLAFATGTRERELYDTVQEELQRMVHLLNDLLDLSRLRTGDQPLERLPTDFADVLRRAQQRFRLPATETSIALDLDLEANLPVVAADRTQIDRLLDNLIGNALRHTPAGGTITLTARSAAEHLAIGVSDTGEGIPHARHALIFQPFVQIGAHRGGAGLGLAICKEIAQQHGGKINMSSLPQHGTTFTVLFPR